MLKGTIIIRTSDFINTIKHPKYTYTYQTIYIHNLNNNFLFQFQIPTHFLIGSSIVKSKSIPINFFVTSTSKVSNLCGSQYLFNCNTISLYFGTINISKMSTIKNNNGEISSAVDSPKDQLNNGVEQNIIVTTDSEVKNCEISESVSSVQSDKLLKKPLLNELIRNVQTQHGNALTVDEENIVIIRGCPSPEHIPFELDGVFIEPFYNIDEDKVRVRAIFFF